MTFCARVFLFYRVKDNSRGTQRDVSYSARYLAGDSCMWLQATAPAAAEKRAEVRRCIHLIVTRILRVLVLKEWGFRSEY